MRCAFARPCWRSSSSAVAMSAMIRRALGSSSRPAGENSGSSAGGQGHRETVHGINAKIATQVIPGAGYHGQVSAGEVNDDAGNVERLPAAPRIERQGVAYR